MAFDFSFNIKRIVFGIYSLQTNFITFEISFSLDLEHALWEQTKIEEVSD